MFIWIKAIRHKDFDSPGGSGEPNEGQIQCEWCQWLLIFWTICQDKMQKITPALGFKKRFESMLKGYVDKCCVWSPLSGPYGRTPTAAYLLLCNLKHFLRPNHKGVEHSSDLRKNVLKKKELNCGLLDYSSPHKRWRLFFKLYSLLSFLKPSHLCWFGPHLV